MKRLPSTVIVLGIVSFLGDVSSEMVFPLLPVFVTTYLGGGPMALGLIEGVADATSSLLKLFSGIYSDRGRRRKTWIVSGYSLTALTRPFMAVVGSWHGALFWRLVDRTGKGVRTSPRDALIADATPPVDRGRAYGFHRAMDHGGAVVGPLVAMALLLLPGFDLRKVFLAASVPAFAAVLVLIWKIKEQPRTSVPSSQSPFRGGLKPFGATFSRYLAVFTLFTLGNSSDAFLLMLLVRRGLSPSRVALLWSIHHVVKMVCNYFGGIASDRFGPKRLLVAGWLIYSVCYMGFALSDTLGLTVFWFLAYGFYYGATEPSQKAFVADLVPEKVRASAFGWFNFATGVTLFPASLGFGWLWQDFGPIPAFSAGAALALVSALGLAWLVPESPINAER